MKGRKVIVEVSTDGAAWNRVAGLNSVSHTQPGNLQEVSEFGEEWAKRITVAGVDGWYLDEDGHSHYIPAPDPELHQVAAAIYPYGDWAHGGDVIGTARAWLSSGEAHRVSQWLDAGVFDAGAAARLAALEIPPKDVAVRVECCGQESELGYWVANGDISPERAAEIVRELATA